MINVKYLVLEMKVDIVEIFEDLSQRHKSITCLCLWYLSLILLRFLRTFVSTWIYGLWQFHRSITCLCLWYSTYSLQFILIFFELWNKHNKWVEFGITTSMTFINASSWSVTKTFDNNFLEANNSFSLCNAHVKFSSLACSI